MNDAEDDDSEADWNADSAEDEPFQEEQPEPSTAEEPAWMQWKRNIRMYAEAVAPRAQPLSPPT